MAPELKEVVELQFERKVYEPCHVLAIKSPSTCYNVHLSPSKESMHLNMNVTYT